MTTTSSTLLGTPGEEAVLRLAEGAPEWLASARSAGWRTWAEGSLPDRALHLWRYTDPTRLLPEGFGEVTSVPTTCRASSLPDGVIACSLTDAVRDHGDLVQRWLGKVAPDAESRWTALSSALWHGGTFLHVARNVKVTEPIHLETIFPTDGGAVFPRLLIVLESGAELSVVDEQVTEDGEAAAKTFVNAVTELVLAANSRLRYAQVQVQGSRTHHSLVQRAHLDRDAHLDAITVALGGRISKADVGTLLQGRGASTDMRGIVFGDGRQQFDHHTVLDHQAPHTTSNLDFKVGLANKAASAYTGLLRIREGAVKSEASQQARNLLLSDGARAEAIPELEILTDDVRAAHGVAAGPLDPLLVFFCQCRGLSRKDAVHTIVRGFFEPIVARVPGEDVQERLRKHLDKKLQAVDVDALANADIATTATSRLGKPSTGLGGVK